MKRKEGWGQMIMERPERMRAKRTEEKDVNGGREGGRRVRERAGAGTEGEGRRMSEGINRCCGERSGGEWWMRLRPLST